MVGCVLEVRREVCGFGLGKVRGVYGLGWGLDCNGWNGWLCVWKRGRDGRWYSGTVEKKGLEKGGSLVRVYRLV
jgi:hypothetical protein